VINPGSSFACSGSEKAEGERETQSLAKPKIKSDLRRVKNGAFIPMKVEFLSEFIELLARRPGTPPIRLEKDH
jgi:hypothetical protein